MSTASPYYNRESQSSTSTKLFNYFTPNRIVSSPVMFGSLPTGVISGVPWRTLLFRPTPLSGQGARPAYANLSGPKDHLLLDWFTMPVVDPYAVNEPFSTAGKVNMHFQIQPFSFVTRDTAVRAALYSELVAQVGTATGSSPINYKCYGSIYGPGSVTPPAGSAMYRLPIYLDEMQGTLAQFIDKFSGTHEFSAGGPTLFKSPSEICDVFLIPRGGDSWPTFKNDWYGSKYTFVGDNVRERPYSSIYPRLTTKSNTFTVHYRVQSLVGPHGTDADAKVWDETKSTIAGESRGSTAIERYVDPTKPGIPDYASDTLDPAIPSLDSFYQWRVLSNDRFAP